MRKGITRNSRILPALGAAVTVLVLTVVVYLGDFYHADETAREALSAPPVGVSVTRYADGSVTFSPPEKRTAGLIFYPGGKVESDAYAPLLEQCAARGVFCVLVRMPGNLAVLDMDAAEDVRAKYAEVERWYIGGHSLGGAIAAAYAAEHTDEYEGLILLAAYSTRDLRESGLRVLTVRGTEDQVLNEEKYESSLPNLPEGYTEVLLDGGCHAYFGSYGAQRGDGTPTIPPAEQQARTAEAVAALAAWDEG